MDRQYLDFKIWSDYMILVNILVTILGLIMFVLGIYGIFGSIIGKIANFDDNKIIIPIFITIIGFALIIIH